MAEKTPLEQTLIEQPDLPFEEYSRILDEEIDRYVLEKFRGFYGTGRTVIFTPIDTRVVIAKVQRRISDLTQTGGAK